MNEKKLRRLLLAAAAGGLLASPAMADDNDYWYGGFSLGQSRVRIDENRINDDLIAAGFAPTQFTRNQDHFAWKTFGGYQFNPYFAIESGYFSLGKFSYTAVTVPRGKLSGEIKLQGINLDLVGMLPITQRLSVFALAGPQFSEAKDIFQGSGAVIIAGSAEPTQRKLGYDFGAGVQFAFSRYVIGRLQAERYRIHDAVGNRGDVDMFSGGLVFPFGRIAPEPVRPPPPPVTVEPPPAVVRAIEAPPPPPIVVERRRVSFSADSLFTFDRSNVRPEGKAALDRFAQELIGTRFQSITVEGYTDRLGPAPYNQRLSVQRAEAVKAYLVEAKGVDAAKIVAVGNGMSAPVTKPGECRGEKRTAALIACLQPDRRVEIEVTGTQK